MTHAVSTPNTAHGASSNLRGGRRLIARGLWLLFAGSVFVNFAVGIPAFYTQQRTVCTTDLTQCTFNNRPTPANVQALHQVGLSLPVFAAFATVFVAAVSLIFFTVGVLIFWRRSDTWLGLFSSLVLIIGGGIANNVPNVLVTSGPLFQLYGHFLILLAFVLILGLAVFLLTFPNGRFEPRWTWIALVLWLVLYASFVVPAPYNTAYWPAILFAGELLLTFGGTMAVQIYRYRRIYTPLERQQTKWLVFGASVGILLEVFSIVTSSLVPGLNAPDSPYQLLGTFFTQLFFLAIPCAVGIAVLRYRLWDIDTIINRALVYGLLTALLAAIYAALVVGLESLTGLITRQANQPLVLVVATLVIVALFQPVRGRVQNVIDRRFYRKKYDAEKTLAAFSATLRDEVDLEQLRESSLAVVTETMQPEHVSLWLRPAAQRSAAQGHPL